jgi:hypothetical protein
VFGQCDSSLSHLENQGVTEGDLFLFFGWFRQTKWEAERLVFVRNAPDLHVLFGWLQVEEVIREPTTNPDVPEWCAEHPHVAAKIGNPNAIFLAKDQLSVPGIESEEPGAGVFDRVRDALVLTEPGQNNRSTWRLPKWFYEAPQLLTYHARRERWTPSGDGVRVETVGRGQEFVTIAPDSPRVGKWFRQVWGLSN